MDKPNPFFDEPPPDSTQDHHPNVYSQTQKFFQDPSDLRSSQEHLRSSQDHDQNRHQHQQVPSHHQFSADELSDRLVATSQHEKEESGVPWNESQIKAMVENGKMDVVDITSFPAQEAQESFTVYSILVEVQLEDQGPLRWEVTRRYRQFNDLHLALVRKWGGSSLGILPTFPSKTIFKNKNDEQLVAQRRTLLTKYLSELLQKRPDISATSEEIHSFLETRKRLYGDGPIRKRILIPLPLTGHDVAQVAVAWKLLSLEPGYRVFFAVGKEAGNIIPISEPKPEPLYEKPPPSFVGGILTPNKEARFFYQELQKSEEYRHPLAWEQIDPALFDGLVITGGYTQGVQFMTANQRLQHFIVKFWKSPTFLQSKVVAAVDKGTLILSRAVFAETGHSVLYSQKTTSLPKWLERVGNYVANTFAPMEAASETPTTCSDLVKQTLVDGRNLIVGPTITGKGTWFDDSNAFVVEDGNYVSGRWTGDIYLLIKKMIRKLDPPPQDKRRQPTFTTPPVVTKPTQDVGKNDHGHGDDDDDEYDYDLDDSQSQSHIAARKAFLGK